MGDLQISVFLIQISLLWFPALKMLAVVVSQIPSPVSLTQETTQIHLSFPSCAITWSLSPDSELGQSYGPPHLLPTSQEIVLYCLTFSVLKPLFHIFCLLFFQVNFGRRVNPIPVGPSFPEAEVRNAYFNLGNTFN